MPVLVGVLDSPFVRRVAITLRIYGMPFEHRPLSVLRHAEAFAQINPMIKAPTLLLEDGDMLVDSAAILDYLDECVAVEQRLTPAGGLERRRVLNVAAIACLACEKANQRWSEERLRPEHKRHAPAIERSDQQMRAALLALEARLPAEGFVLDRLSQADVTAAVAFGFIAATWPETVRALGLQRLPALAARCEALPAFLQTPAAP